MLRWVARSFQLTAILFMVIGIAAIAWAIAYDTPARWGVGIGLGTFVPVAFLFWVLARFVRRQDTSDVLARGLSGTAQVLSVRDTGMTIANVNAVFAARSTVTIPGHPSYEADARVVLPRNMWGAVQPGAIVPVKVDPKDLSRVVADLAAIPPTTGPTSTGILY